MSSELVSAVIGAIAMAAVSLLAVVFQKGRVGDVIYSGSKRRETAVEAIVKLADKAIDGLVAQSAALQQMASNQAQFQQEEGFRYQASRDAVSKQLTLLDHLTDVMEGIQDNQIVLIRYLGAIPIEDLLSKSEDD